MAYRRSTRSRGSYRRSTSRPASRRSARTSGSRRYSRSTRSRSGAGRQQTVRLVIEQAPSSAVARPVAFGLKEAAAPRKAQF